MDVHTYMYMFDCCVHVITNMYSFRDTAAQWFVCKPFKFRNSAPVWQRFVSETTIKLAVHTPTIARDMQLIHLQQPVH